MKNLFLARMMSPQSIFFIAFISITKIASANCGPQTIVCWDYCSNSYVTVRGHSCTTVWNNIRSCYAATGSCSGTNAPICSGRSTNCWDPCSGSYVTFQNANSCITEWSYSQRCYAGIGMCN